jgi:hypothetical protein
MIPAHPGKAQDSSWGQPRGGAPGRRPRLGAITCAPGGPARLRFLGDVRMVPAWPGSRQRTGNGRRLNSSPPSLAGIPGHSGGRCSCGGSYHTDRHPGTAAPRHVTVKCTQIASSGCSVRAPAPPPHGQRPAGSSPLVPVPAPLRIRPAGPLHVHMTIRTLFLALARLGRTSCPGGTLAHGMRTRDWMD